MITIAKPPRQLGCPVCGFGDFAEDTASCPNCKTDLQPVLRIRQLLSDEVSEAKRFYEIGSFETALEHAASAISLDGGSMEARKLIANIYAQLGNRKASLLHWQEAIKIAPDDNDVRDGLAKARRSLMSAFWLRAGAVTVVMVFIAVIIAFVHLKIESLRKDMLDLNTGLKSVAEFQKLHTLNGEAINKISEGLQEAQKVAAGRERELADYRVSHSHTDLDFDNISKSLEEARTAHGTALESLNQLSRARQSAREESERQTQQQEQLKTLVLGALQEVHGTLSNLNTRMRDLEVNSKSNTISPIVEPFRIDVQIRGVTMNATGGKVTLTFDKGLFERSTLFRPEATTMLANIAGLFRSLPSDVEIEIIGYTDEPPFFGDAVSLGYKRALVVARYLQTRTPLAPELISVKSGGVLKSVDSTSSASNTARNRTVVIILRQKASMVQQTSSNKAPL